MNERPNPGQLVETPSMPIRARRWTRRGALILGGGAGAAALLGTGAVIVKHLEAAGLRDQIVANVSSTADRTTRATEISTRIDTNNRLAYLRESEEWVRDWSFKLLVGAALALGLSELLSETPALPPFNSQAPAQPGRSYYP